MAHRGRPPAPRNILPPGLVVNPPLFLQQLEMSMKVVHTTITNSPEICLNWLAQNGLVSNDKNCHRNLSGGKSSMNMFSATYWLAYVSKNLFNSFCELFNKIDFIDKELFLGFI